jgi:hypothetical protein
MKTNQEIQMKLQSAGLTLQRFLAFFCLLALIGLVAFCTLAIWIAITQQAPGFLYPALFDLTMTKAEDPSALELITVLLTNGFILLLVCMMLFVATLVTGDIANNYTPFSKRQPFRLNLIGALMVALTVVPPPLEFFLTLALVPQKTAVLSYGMTTVILTVFALLFFCLAYLFEYGWSLQTESDHTL